MVIEVQQDHDGLTLVKREFTLRRNRLELFRETRVAARPQSNGEFYATLKMLSHPAAPTILQGRETPADLDSEEQEVNAALQKVDDVTVEQEPSNLPNPMHRLFYGEEEFAALLTAGTSFGADQVISITSLVKQGKTLSPGTIAYMYGGSTEEATELAHRLTHYYRVRFVNGRLESLKEKRGMSRKQAWQPVSISGP